MAVVLVEELLERLAEDCEQRVTRAKDEYNRLVRSHLAKETSLGLRGRRGSEHDDAAIPIRVKTGLPSALRDLLGKVQRDGVEVLIALFEGDIQKLRSSAAVVSQLVGRLSKIAPELPECNTKFTMRCRIQSTWQTSY